MSTAVEEAKKVLEALDPASDWEQIMYRMYARQKIDQGLADWKAGRLVSQQDIEAEFLGED